MATYIDNIVKFHTFSKTPVSKDTTLGGAVNPSGHTVTTSQVRAQDIPAFLNTFQGTKEQAITWLGNNYPTPAHNDIVFYGGEFKAGFSTPKCLKWNAKLETPAWEDFDITTATTLKNADEKDVIAVHQNCTTVFVDGSNNAATNSNRNSLFVKKADGTILDHFVASTDKIVAGMPSLGYNALVLWNGAAIDEGELDANYIGNTFAGIVHLNKQYSTGDDAKFKVTCFEYIGDKLDTTLNDIDERIQDIVTTTMEGVVASVGTTQSATNAGISVDSSSKTSPKIDITTGTIGGDSDGKLVTGSTVKTYVDTATETANVSPEGVITEGDESKLVTATSAQNIANKVASDKITAATLTTPEGSSDAINDTTDTSKLVTAEQVKTYVTKNAQVTVTVGETHKTSTGFEFAGSTGTDVTVGAEMDENGKVTYSATLSKATVDSSTGAITNGDLAVSATDAKTIADKAIEAAVEDGSVIDTRIDEVLSANTANVAENGTITPGDEDKFVTAGDANKIADKAITDSLGSSEDGTIGKAISDVAATANSAVQSVTRAEGSSDLITVTDGTDVKISLSTEVATKSYADTAASTAISTSLAGSTTGTIGGAISTAVSDLRTELTTGEGSLGAKITALEGSVKTINDTTIPNAITTAKTQTLGTTITTATGKDNETTPKVTVQLSGTVQTPELSVTTDDIASAKALADLETKVDNFHKAGVSYKVLSSLPDPSVAYNGVIVLVPASADDDPNAVAGDYVEHLCVNKGTEEAPVWAWERIGTTKADLTQYAKTADLYVQETTVNGLTYSQTNGLVSVSVANGSTSQVGTVRLTDTYTSTDATTAATGKSIAAAIETLDATNVGDGAVKVSQTDGIVSSVTVATETLVENSAIKSEVTDANALVTAADALAAIKLAKPENYVASVTGYKTDGTQVTTTQGAAIKVLDSRGTTVTANDLWGTTTTMDASGVITVDHKYLSNPNGGSAWNSSVKSVKDNKAYTSTDASGEPFCNIQTEMIKDGSEMFYSTEIVSFSSDLSSLVNGSNMFRYSSLASFSSDLSSLVNGVGMFQGTHLNSFNGDLSSLVNGVGMFQGTHLNSFSGDLSSLVNGSNMFYETSLTSFSSDLSSLVNGDNMFFYTSLTSFSGDLSSLVNGTNMFSDTALKSFSGDLSSLVNGYRMFASSSLTSFSGDLSSLVNGANMFYNTSLESFNGDLSSLVNGAFMFDNTRLDTESVECIADVINNVKNLSGTITGSDGNTYNVTKRIDIDIANETPSPEENAAFMTMKNEKGWDVYVKGSSYNPTQPTALAMLDENGEEAVAPIPFWAKPIETDEEHAEYVGEDGKFYQVVGGQFIYVSDPETYGQFSSLEDAVANMRLTKYEKPQEEA